MCLGHLNIADFSISLDKSSIFCPKKYLYSRQYCESYVRDFLVMFSGFIRKKAAISKKITFADSVPGIQPPDGSKLSKKSKK